LDYAQEFNTIALNSSFPIGDMRSIFGLARVAKAVWKLADFRRGRNT
jgi:hypothetical protein